MDKRKIIGTIIGVIMFAMLIVGATFAWLTFNANVTNATVYGNTLTYSVQYQKGNTLTEVPILNEGTTTSAAKVTVTAQRPKGSIADNITLYLKSNRSGPITEDGIIKYVVCTAHDVNYQCDENFTNRSIQVVTLNSFNQEKGVEIYSGTLNEISDTPGDKPDFVNTSGPLYEYNIYFWIDYQSLAIEHFEDTYEGYIHADSDQGRGENK